LHRYSGKAFAATAANEPEQYGFNLVILMMGKREPIALFQDFCESFITRSARGFFWTLLACQIDADFRYKVGDAELLANNSAMLLPVHCGLLQTMIDVQGGHRHKKLMAIAQNSNHVQQYCRIKAAAEPDYKTFGVRELRTSAE
jgi:hypothetical protein